MIGIAKNAITITKSTAIIIKALLKNLNITTATKRDDKSVISAANVDEVSILVTGLSSQSCP